jgi:osmotically-inducible protein OsmY
VKRILLLSALLLIAVLFCSRTRAQDAGAVMNRAAAAKDAEAGKTPASYHTPDDDSKMAERIRGSIVNDKNFSIHARNIKIICKGRMITLKGPVRNDEEKAEILTRTKRIAGAGAKIDDQLEVLDN